MSVGGFAERMLALLDQAAVATTYKYALLLAIIDSAMASTAADGTVPEKIEVDDLAVRVLAMYWPQADPFGEVTGVLRQSGTGQAELLTRIVKFRASSQADRSTFAIAQHADGFDRLRRFAAWKLAEMPIPRLQRVGRTYDPFLYQVPWDEGITLATFESPAFDRSIRLVPGAGAELVRLNALVRPLVERLWASRVVVYNQLPYGALERFLFERRRLDATRLRLGLLELQQGRCFYTDDVLRIGDVDVDHFLPWSRSPLDTVENLVVAARRVNNNKRDHLPASDLVEKWRERNRQNTDDLAHIARAHRWETAPSATLGVARALYFPLDEQALLWASPERFVPADPPLLRRALAA